MNPSLRLPLLLSVAAHAALAATVRLEVQALPGQTVIDAWLRPAASTAAVATASAVEPVKQMPTTSSKRVQPTRMPTAAEPAPAPVPAPAYSLATPAPPEVVAVAHSSGGASPVAAAAPASAPVQAPALEPPRYDAAHLSNPEPPYPRSARRRGIEGTVLVEVLVSRRGEAIDVRLIASAGDASLDAAAVDAVHGWRFVPARRGGEAVEAWVRFPVVYRLN